MGINGILELNIILEFLPNKVRIYGELQLCERANKKLRNLEFSRILEFSRYQLISGKILLYPLQCCHYIVHSSRAHAVLRYLSQS